MSSHGMGRRGRTHSGDSGRHRHGHGGSHGSGSASSATGRGDSRPGTASSESRPQSRSSSRKSGRHHHSSSRRQAHSSGSGSGKAAQADRGSTGSSTEPSASGPSKGDKGTIVIHVCDENRKVNRDFICRRDLLLSEMRYFKHYLSNGNASDDVDISVHCDVHIFEWLMKYIHNPDNPPQLEVRSVISILISSNFLEMQRLVEDCLCFLHDRFNSIVKLPIDLGCLTQKLLTKLARKFTDEELDHARDRKDKLLSKMYMHKLEFMFEDTAHKLFCCSACHCLFTAAQRKTMLCSQTKLYVDYHGQAVARHVPNPKWKLRTFIRSLRAQKLSWRRIYWKIWGIVHSLTCSTCGMRFICAAIGHCHYHPQSATFTTADSTSEYPCCGATAYRFDTSAQRSGCAVRDHEVAATGASAEVLRKLLAHRDVATVPYTRAKESYEHLEKEAGAGASEGGDESKEASRGPFSRLTNRPHSPRGDDDTGTVPQVAQDVARSTSLSSWAAATDAKHGAPQGSTAPGLETMDTEEEDDMLPTEYGDYDIAQRSVGGMPIAPLSTLHSKPLTSAVDPRRTRIWTIETQRESDESRMALLMQRLELMRADQKSGSGGNNMRAGLGS